MKLSKWMLLVFFVIAGVMLFGQANLTGVLNLDSVQGYEVNLTLQITNCGTEAFDHSFPSNEICYYSLDGVPVHNGLLPVVTPFNLAPGASESFSFLSTRPLSPGNHTFQAYLAILDNEGNGLPLGEALIVEIEASQSLTIGTGSETARIPIDFYWRSTLYQCIYLASELNQTAGYVTSVTFYPAFTHQSMPAQSIKLFLGNTAQDELSEGWIPATAMTAVFDGLCDFMIGQEELEIPLQQGFYYNGHDNLVLMAFRPIPLDYGITTDPCYADPADLFRSRKACTDSYTWDPYNPPAPSAAQHIAYLPKFSLSLIPYEGSEAQDEAGSPALGEIRHYPNPVKDGCTFVLDKAGLRMGNLTIFNLKGQVVRTLQNNGSGNLIWDGKDQKGISCPSGVYLFKMNDQRSTKPGKLLIVK